MLLLQLISIAFAFLAPLALWLAHRRRPHPAIERAFSRGLAGLLVVLFAAGMVEKQLIGELDAAHALPMQLCDWTLLAVTAALLTRGQTCFELGYFWALCGTVQARFTPAISSELLWTRQLVFFLDHAAIVAGVIFLLLVPKLRPRGLWRIFVWSEIYLVTALVANALAGANYGFLSHPPEQASMLNLFSTAPWLYRLEFNLVALLFFAAAYSPWWLFDRSKAAPVTTAAPTPPV